jgi:hypothetical protein
VKSGKYEKSSAISKNNLTPLRSVCALSVVVLYVTRTKTTHGWSQIVKKDSGKDIYEKEGKIGYIEKFSSTLLRILKETITCARSKQQ